MIKNFLLVFIILSYIYHLYYIFLNYSSNKSISNIVCNDKCRQIIAKCILCMTFFLLIYEINRKSLVSFSIILLLIITINLLINTTEKDLIHLLSGIVCISMMFLFMLYHCRKSFYLKFLVGIQIIFIIMLLIDIIIENKIFLRECLVFSNFGIYFFILHIIKN